MVSQQLPVYKCNTAFRFKGAFHIIIILFYWNLRLRNVAKKVIAVLKRRRGKQHKMFPSIVCRH